MTTPDISKMEDFELAMELAFAQASVVSDWPETVQWLEALQSERTKRGQS